MANATFNNTDDIACLDLFDSVEQCQWLKRCKTIAASLSIIGCLLTIFIIWLYKKYTEFSQRMIIHLCIATLLRAIVYLLVDITLEATIICKIQGALFQFSSWVILLWILSIIFNLLWRVICLKFLEKYEVHTSLVCWGLPIVIAAVPFADDAYAPAGAWCWYKNSFGWMFGTWYVWSMMSFVFMFVSIIVITYKLCASSPDVVGTFGAGYNRTKESIREAVQTLRLYPIAYFLAILFPTIHRIQNVIAGSHKGSFVLVLLHSLTECIFGAVITLVFVMDRRTRQVLNWKSFWEALKKKKFQSEARIHELTLKSRLSHSDFVKAARMSTTSIEITNDIDAKHEQDMTRTVNSGGALETI